MSACRSDIDPPAEEQGMILLNVLVIVLLATAVLAMMIASEDAQVERTSALRSAAQAQAIARGAELSAIAALRRDLVTGAQADTMTEPWATIADADARIAGGRFAFVVADAQDRFNLNNAVRGDPTTRMMLSRITRAAGLPAGSAERIEEHVRDAGPLTDLAALQDLGFDRRQVQRLASLSTTLPEPTDININTSPEIVVAALLGDAGAARMAIDLRNRNGGVDTALLSRAGAMLPPGTSLTSSYFWSRAQVRSGHATQQLTTLLLRRMGPKGPEVIAIKRWRGTPPAEAPALPATGSLQTGERLQIRN